MIYIDLYDSNDKDKVVIVATCDDTSRVKIVASKDVIETENGLDAIAEHIKRQCGTSVSISIKNEGNNGENRNNSKSFKDR